MGGSSDKVILRDLSAHGFRTDWPYVLQKGDRVWLKIPGLEALLATVVWDVNYKIGCKFDTPLHPAILAKIIDLLKEK